MKLLLDTHALIWALSDRKRLSRTIEQLLISHTSNVIVSAASGWEIATKVRLGKLQFDRTFLDTFEHSLQELAFTPLSITASHAVAAGRLQGPHRDPFDRMLAAQALAENMPVATVDKVFSDYGCAVVW